MPADIKIEEPLYSSVIDAFKAHSRIQQGLIGWEEAAQLHENVDLIGALLVRGYSAQVNERDRIVFCNNQKARPSQ